MKRENYCKYEENRENKLRRIMFKMKYTLNIAVYQSKYTDISWP
jgi:hypothetical protein